MEQFGIRESALPADAVLGLEGGARASRPITLTPSVYKTFVALAPAGSSASKKAVTIISDALVEMARSVAAEASHLAAASGAKTVTEESVHRAMHMSRPHALRGGEVGEGGAGSATALEGGEGDEGAAAAAAAAVGLEGGSQSVEGGAAAEKHKRPKSPSKTAAGKSPAKKRARRSPSKSPKSPRSPKKRSTRGSGSGSGSAAAPMSVSRVERLIRKEAIGGMRVSPKAATVLAAELHKRCETLIRASLHSMTESKRKRFMPEDIRAAVQAAAPDSELRKQFGAVLQHRSSPSRSRRDAKRTPQKRTPQKRTPQKRTPQKRRSAK